MMMLQSIVSALVRKNPASKPSDILEVLNRVLYENIRHRLGSDEHVTFSLLHLQPEGRLTFAGAHEDLIVCRAATGRVERISTPGPWVGAVRSVKASAADRTAHLETGDLLVLHTDGVTEARNATGEEYGIDRLVAEVEKHQSQPVDLLRQRLVESVTEWMATQHDDVTLLVLRYRPTSGA
jgi:sigma-B regulation protein RsbU (phosphoserine phosphatase)